MRGAVIVGTLALLAVPLWNLMVAQSPAGVPPTVTQEAAAVVESQANDGATPASAVTALMAGSAVGGRPNSPPPRAVVDLPHPASAFVP